MREKEMLFSGLESKGLVPWSRRGGVGRGGFSMIELLVVIVILAVVVTATIGVTGGIGASKGMTGVHQMAAACDMARARAMKEQREVMLAFANPEIGEGLRGRAVLICAAPEQAETEEALTFEAELKQQRESVLEPLSGWIRLPEGHYFADVGPATPTAGVNVMQILNSQRRVRLPEGGVASLVCLGFGGLGEIVFPEQTSANGAPVLIAIADRPDGQFLSPTDCRWLGLQTHSGAPVILP